MKWIRHALGCGLVILTYAETSGQQQVNSIYGGGSETAPTFDDWNAKFLGIMVRKPDKGKRWIVDSTIANTEGIALQAGDEILEVNDKVITVDDDLPSILTESDTIKIKAKRATTNPKTKRPGKPVTEERTFHKTTYWDYLSKKFTIKPDLLTKEEKWTQTAGANAVLGRTVSGSFIPSIIMKDGEPKHVQMHFRYWNRNLLFIHKITFRHGDKEWIIDEANGLNMKETVLPDGREMESFIHSDGWAEEILHEVGNHPEAESVFRLHGRDSNRDFQLEDSDRSLFADTLRLLKLAKQRHADLAKK